MLLWLDDGVTTTRKPTFTTRQFVRSHGTAPRGRGTWAFQKSTSVDAFDRHLVGDVFFAHGTLVEAKVAAGQHFVGDAWCVAVLP